MKDTIPPLTSLDRISNQVIWKGCGYSDDDMDRPIIGIANAMSDMVPGHTVLDQVARQIKYGIYRAGGTPAEFGTIACCDGLAATAATTMCCLPGTTSPTALRSLPGPTGWTAWCCWAAVTRSCPAC